jgi:hypothetical protein
MAYSTAVVGTAGRGTGASQAVSLANVPAGAMVVVSAALYVSSEGGPVTFPSTLTDNQGNTFTRRQPATQIDSYVNLVQYEGVMAALAASWSLTITQTSGTAGYQWDVVPFYYTANPTTSEFSQSVAGTASGATSLTIGPTASTGASTELGVASFTNDAGGTTDFASATLTTGYSWIYRQNDNSSLQAHAVAEGIQGTSGLNLHSATVSVTASSVASGEQTGAFSTYNVGAGGSAQDTPELRLRGGALQGRAAMAQLLAQ